MRQLNPKEYCKKVRIEIERDGIIRTIAIVESRFNWKNTLVRIELVDDCYILTEQSFESDDTEDLSYFPELCISIFANMKVTKLWVHERLRTISEEERESLIHQLDTYYTSKFFTYGEKI